MPVYINGCLVRACRLLLSSCLSRTFVATLPSVGTEFSLADFAGQHGYQSMTLALNIVNESSVLPGIASKHCTRTSALLKLAMESRCDDWAALLSLARVSDATIFPILGFISNASHPVSFMTATPLVPVAQQKPSTVPQVVSTPSILFNGMLEILAYIASGHSDSGRLAVPAPAFSYAEDAADALMSTLTVSDLTQNTVLAPQLQGCGYRTAIYYARTIRRNAGIPLEITGLRTHRRRTANRGRPPPRFTTLNSLRQGGMDLLLDYY
ncbi:hypothetical protein B0H11DRAFT_2383288 [Mycena galericulata]|nr:hypothetical protein B0H11DRAFT_2383288 [Mycena galericulata]